MSEIAPELLAEARRRYPVGTEFYPAHIEYIPETDKWYRVTGDDFESCGDNGIMIRSCNRPQMFIPIVYEKGKWAITPSKAIEKPTIQNKYQIY